MSETRITICVDDKPKAEFAATAKDSDPNTAQLLRDFMHDFVGQQQQSDAYDAWFRRQVRSGQAAADSGYLLPAAEVDAQFAAKRAATRRRLGWAR